jgi:hypothetical protein
LFSLLQQLYFVAIRRGFLALMWIQFAAETNCTGSLAHSGDENLCGPISWFTFLLPKGNKRRVQRVMMRRRERGAAPYQQFFSENRGGLAAQPSWLAAATPFASRSWR